MATADTRSMIGVTFVTERVKERNLVASSSKNGGRTEEQKATLKKAKMRRDRRERPAWQKQRKKGSR